jgi:hypothetical protein
MDEEIKYNDNGEDHVFDDTTPPYKNEFIRIPRYWFKSIKKSK